MNKEFLKKNAKNPAVLKELKRAHFMIVLLSLGIAALAFVNSAGVITLNGAVLFVLVLLSLLIAATSAFIFVKIPRK